MTPDRWQKIEELYHAALKLDQIERAAFLEQACAGDEDLRREVESLLASDAQAESFLESPVLVVAARALVAEGPPSLGISVLTASLDPVLRDWRSDIL